jgi:DnaJ-class molecular chaperone
MTPFEILQIAPTDDKMAIRRAYVIAAKANHPDVTGDDGEQFQIIQTAYDSLIDADFKQTTIDTTVSLELADFLFGCRATVVLKAGPFRGTVLEFDVAAFTDPGTTVEFYDSGSTNRQVRVTLMETIKDTYTRRGNGIVILKQINMLEAELGTTMTVTNFDGIPHTITIAPETTANRLIYIFNEAGFYNKQTHHRGTLTIIVGIEQQRYTDV